MMLVNDFEQCLTETALTKNNNYLVPPVRSRFTSDLSRRFPKPNVVVMVIDAQ